MRLRLAAVVMAVLTVGLGEVQAACTPASGAAHDLAVSWAATCGGPPCGTLVDATARAKPPPPTAHCTDDVWHALTAALARVRDAGGIILLGEVHDNPGHHEFRARLVDALLDATDKRPGIVMEHVRADQKEALAAVSRPGGTGPATPEAFFEALAWPKSGWPDQAIFAPLVATLLGHDLSILPGEPPRGVVRDMAMKGMAALAAGDPLAPSLAEPLPDTLQSALLDELEASHCGLMPRTAFGGMALAQRYRDAFQAAALLAARKAHGGALLLAGNGHVRADRGVPYYLRRLAPQVPMLSLQLVEREEGGRDAHVYVQRGPDGAPTADFFLITPRTARPDPCDAMRARFKRRSAPPPPAKAP